MTNVWLPPMNAGDVMTKNVVTVGPETPTRTVAKLLLEKGFSAVPVIADNGAVIGMVSESDLIASEIGALAPRRAGGSNSLRRVRISPRSSSTI